MRFEQRDLITAFYEVIGVVLHGGAMISQLAAMKVKFAEEEVFFDAENRSAFGDGR